jgi:hypothetical protein
METERITLNQRERDRLRVLHEIKGKHISQIELFGANPSMLHCK